MPYVDRKTFHTLFLKFGYDLDDNGYYVPCEKEQQVIRRMLLMRKQGKSYRDISSEMTKSQRKLFPVSWVHKIVKRELA